MGEKILDGQTFISLISGGAANLRANASVVNNLNVFPIPDGDTGTNMSMTLDGGLRYLERYDGNSVSEAASILSDGMLLGARGNSGVILSQFFAGIAAGLKDRDTVRLPELAAALKAGVKKGYNAVIEPTEGTILTVAREAVEYATSRITDNSTFRSFADDYLQELNASLQRTPELLAVLKEAGVIDSGGAGLFYIVDGIIEAADGRQPVDTVFHEQNTKLPEISVFNENSVMDFGYCTEFLLQLQTIKVDPSAFSVDELITYLQTVGDSIVAFQTGTIVKVHIHTMSPGIVLTHCQKYGEFLTLKIENMTLQHSKTAIENQYQTVKKKERMRKKFALVTVAMGEGIKKTFIDLGADVVIDGGQGNNPSAEDFTNAFEKADAEVIFVLPNNGNILMAAKQAAGLYKSSDVRVIETKNIGEGYAALTMLNYDSDDVDEISKALIEATSGVVTGFVTKSVRSANIDGVEIKKGDYIGFTDKKMLSSSDDKCATAEELLEKLSVGDHEFLIVIYGALTDSADRADLTDALSVVYPDLELHEIFGGSESYDFTFILE